MSEPLIAADRLSFRSGGLHILDRVSLAVHPREIVTLIGPNGSGKTTLLKAILGLVPAEGEIKRRPALKIGYVPQQFERDASLPMTVMRFLALFAPFKAGAAALARVGVAQAANRQLGALSGGELARVLLARAIAGRPDLLVLDEPTAGVDVSGEAELYHLIAAIRDEFGCGVLLVSHDLHVVMAQSDQVVCLNRHVCCEGRPATVAGHPEYVRLFGPKAAASLGIYEHHHDHTHTLAGDVVCDGRAHG